MITALNDDEITKLYLVMNQPAPFSKKMEDTRHFFYVVNNAEDFLVLTKEEKDFQRYINLINFLDFASKEKNLPGYVMKELKDILKHERETTTKETFRKSNIIIPSSQIYTP